jgi:predicted kinase
MEGSSADDESSGRGKETQADFLLGSRGAPELPLAAAVSGESQSRNRNQNRPARRRRRGGRGGARRGPGGIADTPLAADATAGQRQRSAGTGSAGSGLAETVARPAHVSEAMPLDEPLTPESAGGETSALAPQVSAEATSTVRSGSRPASLAGAAPAVPAAPRLSKGTVVLAIGLPGSGKSSWFKRHDIHPLSSDLLRELLFDDAQEQRFQDLVFSNLRSMLKARLIARRPLNYVDATNLTPHDRHSWIKLAKDYGYDVQGLFFDVPLEVCLERHARRGRAVPEDIMRKMAGKLKPPTFEEGFSKITVVRVKQKDAAAG